MTLLNAPALKIACRRHTASLASVLLVAVIAGSCKGGGSTAPPAPSTFGVLRVNVSPPTTKPVPNGSVQVTVEGPGYVRHFTNSTILAGLVPGTYSVVATTVESDDETVLYVPHITGSPAMIAGTDTLIVSVSYSLAPGSGGLWVVSANAGSPIAAEYGSNPPLASVTARPADAGSAAFDTLGNLWIVSPTANTLTEYTPDELMSPAVGPAVTITGSGLNGPMGLAFDAAENLWIANATGNTLVRYSQGQLTTSGSPSPTMVLTSSALSGPAQLAFDLNGDLWVPNMTANTVVEFTPSQLISGNRAPAATITSVAGSLASPRAIAFDFEGSMYVANFTGNTIQEYGLNDGGGMTQGGAITIAAPDAGPTAIAINGYDVYVVTATGSHLIRYGVTTVSTPVAPGPTGLAFDPPPVGAGLDGRDGHIMRPRTAAAAHLERAQ